MPKAKESIPNTPEPLVVCEVKQKMNYSTPKMWKHPFHTIGVRISGFGYYRLGNVEAPTTGPFMTFNPKYEGDENGLVGKVEAWWASFHWDDLEIISVQGNDIDLRWGQRRNRVPRFKMMDALAITRAIGFFKELHREVSRTDMAGRMLARAKMMQLFSFYLDLPESEAAPVGHRTLSRFYDLLADEACEDKTIEDIAFDAGGSADHLRELFRERYGIRPVEYRTRIRMQRARQLLASTGLNVSEVAIKTGYPDPLYFSRVFKSSFGVSPREIIRRFRLPVRGK